MIPENALFEVDYQYFLNDGPKFVAFDYAEVPAFQDVRQAHQDRMLEGFKAGGVRRGEYRRAMGLPELGPEDDDVFVLSPMMLEFPAGAVNVQTQQGGAEAVDQAKVLRLPLKKKAL